MAEAADVPEGAALTGCKRAEEMPETASAFADEGQSPRAPFRRVEPMSPFVAVPVDCVEEMEALEAVEDCEERDEDEFERWALLRGATKMRPATSSELMVTGPGPGQPLRVSPLVYEGGEATAVIEAAVAGPRGLLQLEMVAKPGVPAGSRQRARNKRREGRPASRASLIAIRGVQPSFVKVLTHKSARRKKRSG